MMFNKELFEYLHAVFVIVPFFTVFMSPMDFTFLDYFIRGFIFPLAKHWDNCLVILKGSLINP